MSDWYDILIECGWYRELHTFLGKKEYHWHKDGYEVKEKDITKLFNKIWMEDKRWQMKKKF